MKYDVLDVDPKEFEKAKAYINSLKLKDRYELAILLNDDDGFEAAVLNIYNKKKPEEEDWVPSKNSAYERVEACFVYIFNHRRYRSYDSYRTCMAKKKSPKKEMQ